MNRLLILLFGIVSTTAVLILLVLLYRYANENPNPAYLNETVSERGLRQHSEKESPQKRWLEDLAVKKRPSFTYAVSEMEIDLPLRTTPRPKTSYRLLLKDLDGYRMFCLRQVLERNGIDYSIVRRGDEAVLVVNGLDRPRLDRVVHLVKEYDVKIKIESNANKS
ncbi:hypothetical protein [Hydrogenimonas sp. SS33]|uniref:hypothetical protein n=1 Tax=Hydrogenimonas leucolamina TaxID=2954236 RepID=UPI00336BEA63